jgi:hypothetical protein
MVLHADPASLSDSEHRRLLHPGQRQIATDQYHWLTIGRIREILQTQGDIMLRQ